MPLIKERRVAVADPWVAVADDDAIPADAAAIVSGARWVAERETLLGRNAPLGVRLKPDQGPETIAADLDRLALIAVEFPAYTDGRGYSTARLLRERYGYAGELRAVGNVLRDQLAFMARCGFDAFEYAGRTPVEQALAAFDEISVVYQTAADRRRAAAVERSDRSRVFLNGTCG